MQTLYRLNPYSNGIYSMSIFAFYHGEKRCYVLILILMEYIL